MEDIHHQHYSSVVVTSSRSRELKASLNTSDHESRETLNNDVHDRNKLLLPEDNFTCSLELLYAIAY